MGSEKRTLEDCNCPRRSNQSRHPAGLTASSKVDDIRREFVALLCREGPMARITLEEAAVRLGISNAVLAEMAQRGLFALHGGPHEKPCVDETELADLAESLGWLQLSADRWEDEDS